MSLLSEKVLADLSNGKLPPFINFINQFLRYDEEQYDNDIEAITEELREVIKERDDLRRQLRNVRAAHEELYRALYPGLKWNLEK